MTARVFVDTNVVVYAFDEDASAKQVRAAAWVDRLLAFGVCRTSVQVISESFSVLTRAQPAGTCLARADAWARVSDMFLWDPVPVDELLLRLAMTVQDRYALSWWDSLIVAAAQRQGCDYLLTEDLQDGQDLGGVVVVNPFAHAPEEYA